MAQIKDQLSKQKLNELQMKIWTKVVVEEQYKDPHYSARQLASDLATNTRYISAVMQHRFQKSFSAFMNDWRVEEAIRLMNSKQGPELTLEKIAQLSGFANRQTFYTAFTKKTGCTPKHFKDGIK